MSRYRISRHVPWYHQPKPRCQALTHKGDQCIFSASYVATGKGLREQEVCKAHADMLVMDGYKARRITDRRVNLDTWGQRSLRAV